MTMGAVRIATICLFALAAGCAAAPDDEGASSSSEENAIHIGALGTWTLDRAFAFELAEVSLGDPDGLTRLWLGTYDGDRYDAAWHRGWRGRVHVDHLVIAGSGAPEPGRNDLGTFPYPDGSIRVPCLQSIGDIKSAVMIRSSNGIEAYERLKSFDVAGAHLYGHSAGAWVAAIVAVVGGAAEADVYGVPFFFPVNGDLRVESTTIHFHTHFLDPVGWAFDPIKAAAVGKVANDRYGSLDHDHTDYRSAGAPWPQALTADQWDLVRRFLAVRLDVARGNHVVETCWGGQPCVVDHLGGAGL